MLTSVEKTALTGLILAIIAMILLFIGIILLILDISPWFTMFLGSAVVFSALGFTIIISVLIGISAAFEE